MRLINNEIYQELLEYCHDLDVCASWARNSINWTEEKFCFGNAVVGAQYKVENSVLYFAKKAWLKHLGINLIYGLYVLRFKSEPDFHGYEREPNNFER